MKLSFWAPLPRRQDGLPKDIYISLVGSLYQDSRTLVIGSVGASAAAFLTAMWTGEMWLLVFAVAVPSIACLRALDMRRFARRRKTLTVEAARVWELRYVIGAAVSVVLLGGWCVTTFIVSDDTFLRILTFAGLVAYMVGISGRNFP